MPIRIRAMRKITKRFAWIGGIGLVMLVVAGGYLIGDWRKYYHQEDTGFFDIRFGPIFVAKMIVLLVMLTLLAFHTFRTGPRLIDAMEAQANGSRTVTDAQVRSLRMQSMFLSISVLVLTLVIMVAGVMLNTATFSMRS
jgi:putative copper export protein